MPPFGYPVSYIILRFFTTGLNRIYWYLISLILTCFLCRRLWKNGYTVHLICGGLFLYLIAMTYDSYSFLFENTFLAKAGEAHRFIWAWPQAGFNESVLFLSIGVYLKHKKPQIRNLNLLLCLSLACLIGEGYFCQAHGAADANCYLSLIPASILLFLYAEAHPDMLKMKYAGELSLYIYMVHIYFSYISAALSQNTLIRFFFIAAVSVSISVLILLAGRKMRRNKL